MSTANSLPLGFVCCSKATPFKLLATTKSLLFLVLLLISSVAAAVDSLKPLEKSSTTPLEENFSEYKCFIDNKPYMPAPFLNHHQAAIGFQVTGEPMHQLVTRIFAIFLREFLLYDNITIVQLTYDGDTAKKEFDIHKFYNGFYELKYNPLVYKMGMINLGVWMSSATHTVVPENIYDAGSIWPAGRFGWFIPRSMMGNTTIDYRIFLNDTLPEYQSFIIDEGVLKALCLNIDCEHFVSPQCENRRCVTLLAGHRRHTAFIQRHIDEMKSYVNVLWLGDLLKEKVTHLYRSYNENETYHGSRFIVLHWSLSDVIDDDINFGHILMPPCEDSEAFMTSACKYELTPVLKYFTKPIDTVVNSPLMHALRNIYFTVELFKELQGSLRETTQRLQFESKSKSDIYNFVACNWMKTHGHVYENWLGSEPNITLSIGGIFPITEDSRGHHDLASAVQRAVDAINRNETLLKGYNFNLLVNDGQCRADIVMKTFIHYYNVPYVMGVLGPACSETVEPIAGISKHTNMAVISYSAEGALFTDRKAYPYFFRTIGSNRQYKDVYISLMQELGWRRVAALTEDGQKYTEYIAHMEANMKFKNFQLIANKKFSSDVTSTDMHKYLSDLKERHAKIIIADIHNRNAELALCVALKLGMTAYEGYVWFLPSWLSKDWSKLSRRSNESCTTEELQKAYEGHFTLIHAPFGNPSNKMQENITIESWLESYKTPNTSISKYAGFAYDAAWAYALAADKLVRENKDALNHLRTKNVVKRFVELIWETDFEGLSGRVRFGEGGSRFSEVDIMQWVGSEFVPVGKFYPNITRYGKDLRLNGGELKLEQQKIKWLSGIHPPGDGTYDCGLSGLAAFMGTDCSTTATVVVAFVVLSVALLLASISFLYWKNRYNSKLKESAKIMKTFGIDLLSPSRNKTNTLDKWEIPKENVVVNRRLGEGAFGTVYGGEAQLKSEVWTAVAVKTLKAGASTEDRLDFLSEAEAMKRLDHKNIVKLLGVCLQSEPIYTIMEFMLYGDLKTYLLARRHMVNDKITDESDICSKRLTRYAMDVARGLVYLAEQKYVHRDLACRNCLVNAERVVKLGDFGMARPVFESDYYRFNRKGMLPVRWMAPESLALGMFTPASDVWAFGVVVFEIITFGSFPFQGMTNNQVLEYVKSGKTLQTPIDAKPHLDTLLQSCWDQDVKKRPTATEIVDFLSNHPRLLTACLDYPGASVEMPETSSDEFELLPKSRKCSPSKRDVTLDILAPTASLSNFDRTRALIDDLEISDCNSIHIDLQVDERVDENPIHIESFSPTTPDGYSIMSPLLLHQMSENSDSSQARLLKKYSNETLQQTPF